MALRVLRVAGIGLAIAYAGWNLHHEYTLKFFHAGALNIATWRALNADSDGAAIVALNNAELMIPRHPLPCGAPPDAVAFPANCDFFGGDFGGKARNCDYWWLGRQCFVYYVPAAVYDQPALRGRILRALSHPCEVLFDPRLGTEIAEEAVDDFAARARLAFGCEGAWLDLKQEVQLYIIDADGHHRMRTIEML